MVGEFPDLQGIMGSYYATHDGESEAVSRAIREHYRPTFSGDAIPGSAEASCVAIADKLDTLVGLFGIGQPPSGSKDPFALRRQTIGIIRICIENDLPLDITSTISAAADTYDKGFDTDALYHYFLDRLGNWYTERGIESDIFDAVRNSRSGIHQLNETNQRIQALQSFQRFCSTRYHRPNSITTGFI